MVSSSAKLSIDACNCFAVRRAARQITRLYDAHLEEAGLGITQFLILATLGEVGSLTVNGFAERLDVERTAMGKMLATLERDGHVGFQSLPVDRRTRLAELTGEGRALLERATPLWRRAQQAIADAGGTGKVDAIRDGFGLPHEGVRDQTAFVQ